MLTNEEKQALIDKAVEAYSKAYAPYSKYSVGAALIGDSGKVYDGINIENAVYPVTICAERVAIFKAVSEGEKSFSTLAVVTKNGGTPCGSCRQVMAEFNPHALVLIANAKGELKGEYRVHELLPSAFGDGDLEEARE